MGLIGVTLAHLSRPIPERLKIANIMSIGPTKKTRYLQTAVDATKRHMAGQLGWARRGRGDKGM